MKIIGDVDMGDRAWLSYSDRVTWGKNFSMPNLNYLFLCLYVFSSATIAQSGKHHSFFPLPSFLFFSLSIMFLVTLGSFHGKNPKGSTKKRERERDSVLERV